MDDLALAPAKWNPDTERNVLAAVLHGHNPRRLDLEPTDFYEPAHEHLYHQILEAHDTGHTPDFALIQARLNPANRQDRAAFDLLPDLLLRGTTPNLTTLADALVEARRVRHIQSVVVKTMQAIQDGRTADDITAAITTDLKQHIPRSASRTLAEIMPDVIQRIEEGQMHGLSTPWPGLDKLMHGLSGGEFTIIAGRPAQGKSLAAQNLATHWTNHHDQHVMFVSLEMTDVGIGSRIVSDIASIEQDDLMSPKRMAEGGKWDRLQQRMSRLTDRRLHITSSRSQTLSQIVREANNLHQRHGLGLVVVDYLQLVTPRDQRINRDLQVGEISRGCKSLALDLNIPVVGLSQFNREGARDNRPPRLSDLRESGSLEQDADNVIGLHRPEPDAPSYGLMLCLKARKGRTGETEVRMATEYARIATPTHPWQGVA